MTLGGAAAAVVRLIVWCWDCGHQVYAREVINKRFALVGKPYRRNALAASIQAAVERGKRVQGPVEAD
jgi:hypothetical protein